MRVSKSRRLGFVASGLSGLLALSCGGPTVADLQQDEVLLTARAVGGSPDGLEVSRAFVSASALSLLPCRADASDLVLGARGYDLLLNPPMSERVTTAVTDLCGLLVDVDPVAEAASAGVPDGASLYIEGQDADGAPLALTSQSSLSLLFEADSGSSFGEQPLLLGFDLSAWLAGLPLPEDMAETSAMLFDSQIRDCAALYVDSNGNGALDEDEQTPVARASTPR
jgi:hypothetical protein